MTVKTTAGPVTLARPKVRGTSERFASQLFGTGVSKTNALETLVIASFVRGLSTRDVEAALAEALGVSATVSRSSVSRVCADLKTQYDAWRTSRLGEVELDYLFLDASHLEYHANASAEPVLAAWGITTDGRPVFVGLETAAAESHDAWADFLTGLGERGLACPAAGDLRRCARSDRRGGDHDGGCAASAVSDPPREERARQDPEERPDPGQGRLLGDLRRA